MPGIFGRIFAKFRKTPTQKKQVAQIKEDAAVIKFRTARAKDRAIKQMGKRHSSHKGVYDTTPADAYFKRKQESSEKERKIAFEGLIKKRRELKKASQRTKLASKK